MTTPDTTAGIRRRSILWALAGLLVGALGASALFWKMNPSAPAEAGLRFSVLTNFPGVSAQPSLSPDGRSFVFVSNQDGQYDLWVGLVTGENLVPITRDLHLESRPRWSPDGSRIAYARMNDSGLWDVWIVPATGGPARRILSNATDPAWTPDGVSLAYVNLAGRGFWLSDPTGGNAKPLVEGELPTAFYRQPSFSHDGRQIAFVRRAVGPYGELAVAEVSTGKLRHLTSDGANVLSPVWSPDDQFIYFASSRGGSTNIWKVPARGGTPERISAGQSEDSDLDISADGRRIVFSSYRQNTNIAEVRLGSAASPPLLSWLTHDPARTTLAPAYSPDGKRIAYTSDHGGAENENIWVANSDGSQSELVIEGLINLFPSWSEDGQALVFTSRRPGVTFERKVRRLAISDHRIDEFPVISLEDSGTDIGPDGRLLFRALDRQAWLFDPKSGKTQTLKKVFGRVLRWSPDGKHLASIVSGQRENDPEAGLWLYGLVGGSRVLFHGWVVWYAWGSAEEIFMLKGSPDLRGSIWRVRLDGAQPEQVSAPMDLRYHFFGSGIDMRFDVHPDGRRAAVEIPRVEANIGMMENRGQGAEVRGQGGGQ